MKKKFKKFLILLKNQNFCLNWGKKEIRKETYQTRDEIGIEKHYQREQMSILISHSKEDLDLLIQALQTKSDELLGKAFGFPQTTVEAFIGKKNLILILFLKK